MIIYEQENSDGLSEKISGSFSIAYNSLLSPFTVENNKFRDKIAASFNDPDLYYVQSILVSSSWNRNDDIFDKKEIWAARHTPEDKPTNLEHNENLIIGHITSNWPITVEGELIPEDISPDDLPEKYHILTGSVIYRAYSSEDLRERTENLIHSIQSGNKYVSMECLFKGFDYGLINSSNNEYKILSRNNDTAYLTKYLKAYGGNGENNEYKIGRVLRNITFTGKGFVNKPANEESIIFNKTLFNENKKEQFLEKRKNTNLIKYGHDNPFANDDIKSKIVETMRNKYGTDHHMQSKEMKERVKNKYINKYV